MPSGTIASNNQLNFALFKRLPFDAIRCIDGRRLSFGDPVPWGGGIRDSLPRRNTL
jgi:hypothetical protein